MKEQLACLSNRQLAALNDLRAERRQCIGEQEHEREEEEKTNKQPVSWEHAQIAMAICLVGRRANGRILETDWVKLISEYGHNANKRSRAGAWVEDG